MPPIEVIQRFKAGNVTWDEFLELMKTWNWHPVTTIKITDGFVTLADLEEEQPEATAYVGKETGADAGLYTKYWPQLQRDIFPALREAARKRGNTKAWRELSHLEIELFGNFTRLQRARTLEEQTAALEALRANRSSLWARIHIEPMKVEQAAEGQEWDALQALIDRLGTDCIILELQLGGKWPGGEAVARPPRQAERQQAERAQDITEHSNQQ